MSEEVRLNQKNVLAYLKRQAEPRSATDIRFMLDASSIGYPLSRRCLCRWWSRWEWSCETDER